jgi:hypothetical protein
MGYKQRARFAAFAMKLLFQRHGRTAGEKKIYRGRDVVASAGSDL